ncbi:tripartite tricarboxylate transporter TctB family protein [Agrococcus sp. ARC_14]|uniref:tripartite tricarboxylate transporter TctB family protein n=1 Tax=Agrococcus sp. ARC_14 TaxID=2919927 RepID=UPI001F05EB2F|nr:tripartite tricarboxylate transporter TctB family protein [Agrococcus sp. ARC_14]MCH1881899.1 tripartite tricarboxylate transporter TctB family protein [Agrococcus sp. ARC_14]
MTHEEQPKAAVAELAWTPLTFRIANIVGAVLAIALAATILLASGDFAFRVRDLPGPAFFPVVIGVALLACSVAWLVLAIIGRLRPDDDTEPPPDRQALLRAGAALAVVGVSAFVLQPLGYPLTVAIAVTVLVLLARGRLRAAIPTGVGFAVASFLLVTTALGVQLPTGVLRPLLVGLL